MKKILSLVLISLLTFNMFSIPVFADEGNKTITISYTGDCTLGTYKGQSGYLFSNYYADNGKDYFFSNVKDIFTKDDLTFINLEGPLTSETQKVQKSFPIKGNPEYVEIIKDSSIEVCNLANNHILDCGQKGLDDTVKILSDNNISYCGMGNVARKNVKGINISFLGYKTWDANKEFKDSLAKDIKEEKETHKANLVIVEFHWGTERDYVSSKYQEELAHFAINSGADAIIGAHPHVLQGIEKYNGKNIYYSLGNFCFGANKNPKDKDTLIIQETYTFDKNNNLVDIKETVIPCKISSQSSTNDYKPTIEKDEKEINRILEKLRNSSKKYSETVKSIQK